MILIQFCLHVSQALDTSSAQISIDTLDIQILWIAASQFAAQQQRPIRFLVQPYNDQATVTLDTDIVNTLQCAEHTVRTHCIGTDNGHLSLCKGQIFVLDSAQNKNSATFSRQLRQQLWDFVYIEEYDTALQQYIHSVRRGVVKSFLRSYFFFEVEIM